jgi:hypothetical protein
MMAEKVKDETTNEIRELTQDEIAAVSGGNRCLSYVPAPVEGGQGEIAGPNGHSRTVITFDPRQLK